ncbi:13503_t:CDS:2 [Rhizophagus irregularis]|nr:13503_t:CDS:2 [Rhizophagus irregularis]
MSPDNLLTSKEDRRPLIIKEDIDFESHSNSSVENFNFMEQSNSSTANPFASFDEVFCHNNKPSPSRNKRPKYYQSVGELLWQNGQMYSDVRLTFEDRGVLASSAGIPSELRLHSLVLYQSQFFKDQLSVTSAAVPTSPNSNIIKEKQIIVRLPSHVIEEDMINFHCTLKLMYTKNWDNELANNLTKGVGCLSVCCEIGFYEGIEACWKCGSFSKQPISPLHKFNRSDTSISSDSSASPRLRYENESTYSPPSISLPSPPHSNSENSPITSNFPSIPSISPPSIFSNSRILNNWISNFESYAISSKRACSKMLPDSRQDSKCFPFLEHFVSVFESINQLGRAKRITSPEALDYTLLLHESLDEPISQIAKNILAPIEQKHLSSRVSKVEHMVVGEKMAKLIRDIRSSISNIRSS